MIRLKTLYQSFIVITLSILFVIFSRSYAIAGTPGTVTLTLDNENVTFQVYQIGTLSATNNKWDFTITNDFAEAGFTIGVLEQNASDQAKKALELQNYAIQKSLTPYQVGTSNTNKEIAFKNIIDGVYLFVKDDTTAKNVLIDPFFVTMPIRDENGTGYFYDFKCDPKSQETIAKGHITIKKISESSNRPLNGAQFQLLNRKIGSSSEWIQYGAILETAGSDGSIQIDLPEDYWNYEYQLLETKAPSGYYKSRVGTITFTMAQNGTIVNWNSTGTTGYVTLSEDKTTFIVKNYTSGGGGGDPDPPTRPAPTDPTTPPTNPTTPTDPEPPTIPYNPDPEKPGIIVPPGDVVIEGPDGPVYEGKTPDGHIDIDLPPGRYKITVIGEDGIPLTYFMDVPVPLAGLARTGDTALSTLMLVITMFAALGVLGTLVYVKRKNEKL